MPNESTVIDFREELKIVSRLSKDLRKAATLMSLQEIRYLVDAYYQIQECRKASANQFRSLEEAKEPGTVIEWLYRQNEIIENQIKAALDKWGDGQDVGRWAKSITGIGPVISAGLMAHIDIEKAPTVGHIWRYAGLDPTQEWKKGEKRPWNAALKVLCWKLGESFVKFSGHKNDFYGKLYLARKEAEQKRNDAGHLAEQASAKLDKFKIGKDTDAYKAYSIGKLPPAHIHARAKRYAVKLFLSHYQHVAYRYRYGQDPPKPFAIAILGHADMIAVPNWPF